MAETVKSCIFCANVCDYYFFQMAPQCNELLGEEASNLRQATAWGCEKYKVTNK